jgi:uncharacterized protein YbaA (DUF1428 family)
MAHYVDGFDVPVPQRNLDAYREMADPRLKDMMDRRLRFDGMRMLCGGFKGLVELP